MAQEHIDNYIGWFDVEVTNFGGSIGTLFLMTSPSKSANIYEIPALFSISCP